MTDYLGEWQPDYEIGIEDIDLQHHFFFNLINRITAEINNNADYQYRMDLINELQAYAKFHFISEENKMRKAEYPDFLRHRFRHFELIENLSRIGNLLYIEGDESDEFKLASFLKDWFLTHTRDEDRKFADYLLKR